ncbi:MAG: S41 family peptidase [Candidatus Aminicenantes bacterium]|nr:S41 family peptidase [Candidatus Aminicenantes bacterium]
MIAKQSKKSVLTFMYSFLCFFLLSTLAFSQGQKDIKLTPELKAEVVEGVGKLLADNYIYTETAKKMEEHILQQLKEGKYNDVTNVDEFARVLTQDLRSISKDKHIRVGFSPEAVKSIRARESISEEEREKERKERLEEARQRNFSFQRVEIREGNIGYLDLRGFTGYPEASETIIAAMNFLANANAVIIDLRNNGGGSPFAIQIISSYFLEEHTHLNSFKWRHEDTIRQFWTERYVPGKKMYDTDLYILTSRRTFSAAEEFTYNLKNLKRATIVGETTGGGAHPGGSRIVNDYFLVWVPSGRAINPITKSNWEGEGIEPHISVPEEKALEKAHYTALEKLLEKTENETKKSRIQWSMDSIKARMNPIVIKADILQKYVGRYSRGEIVLESGQLYFKVGPQKLELIPLSETQFMIESQPNVRIEFIPDETGRKFDAKAYFIDGTDEVVKRIKKKEKSCSV